MAKKVPQFHLEVADRVDRDADPLVGDPFDLDIPALVDPDDEDVTLVDGRTIRFEPPNLSRFISMQVQYELSDDIWSLSNSMMTLVHSCMKEDDRRYVRRRFNDPSDPFHIEEMTKIITFMMETWSTRPTKKGSGSSSSQRKSGPASTPKQLSPVETSSES